jgi:uncharacterized delta-60 repeat protein/uncharacterized repeat protein (TIGR01451 family)
MYAAPRGFLRNAVLTVLFGLLFALSLAAAAQSGTFIDKRLLAIPGGNNVSTRAVVQPDGKILVVGHARNGTMQMALTRYNADGSLDTSFGTGGTMLEWLGPGDAETWAVALQSDGKIVVAGHVRSDRDKFGIARFNADGTLDLGFGGGGAATSVGPGDAGAYAMAIQPDGKIVLGGYSIGATGKKVFTLVRYNSDCTLDTSFGSGGVATAPEGSGDEVIKSLGLQGDGKIVAAGPGTTYLAMRRFNADGSLDSSWTTTTNTTINGGNDLAIQSDGKVVIAVGVPDGAAQGLGVLRVTSTGAPDATFGAGSCAAGPCPGVAEMLVGDDAVAMGLVLLSNGNIVISGNTITGGGVGVVVIARFTSAGAIDTTFGTSSGHTGASLATDRDQGAGLAMRSDGRFVVAGSGRGAHGDFDSLVVAFTANGAVDTTFNGSGFRQLDVGSITSTAFANALQADGKLVAVGSTTTESPSSTTGGVIARYLADGTVDTTFGTGGITTFDWPAHAVAVQPDGKIVVGGYKLVSNVRSMTFARFQPDGTLDTSFGSGGTFTIAASSSDEEITSIAIQPDGKIVAAGWITPGTFTDSVFVRLTPAGALDSAFNGGGIATVAMSTGSDQVNAIALQSDGGIVGAGWAEISGEQDSISATRLDANGLLDTAFGTNGIATVNFGAHTSNGNAVAIQGDGRIVIGGRVFNGSTDDFALARLTTSGALDSSFGSGGVASNDFGNHNRIFALRLLSSGKIVAAGENGGEFGIAQYLANGTLDTSFGTGGVTTFAVNAGADEAFGLSIASDGTLLLSGAGSGAFASARVAGEGGGTPPTPVDLAITQSSNLDPASQGKDVMFTLLVSNHGATSASNVTVTNPIAGGATYVWASQGCSNGSGTVTCTASSLATGASVQFQVVLRPSAAGSMSNTATVASTEPESNAADNSTSLTIAVNATPAANIVLRYRLYNDGTKEHLYTTDLNEYNTLGANGWNQEGTIGHVLDNPGSFNGVTATPYYRLYNDQTFWHHWTTDPNEYYTLVQFPNWHGEGVDGYILPTGTTGTVPLYRLLYPFIAGLHHWTIDQNEYDTLTTQYGWVGEGGTGFVIQ